MNKQPPNPRHERFVMEKGQFTVHHPDGTEITPEELAKRPSRPLGGSQERQGPKPAIPGPKSR